MSRREREARKQELLTMIQQQRTDLDACKHQWAALTYRYDHMWSQVLSYRHFITVGSGILALWTLRRPKRLARWVKRGVGLWSSWRMIKKMLPKK